jgi:hypothetical protein
MLGGCGLKCLLSSDSESQISYALKTTKNSLPISQAQTTPSSSHKYERKRTIQIVGSSVV